MPVFTPSTFGAIGKVTLKVRDLDSVTNFYRDILGLAVLAQGDPRLAPLAAGDEVIEPVLALVAR
ncbi:MAG: VOC family protein [Rhizobiaceae bacterium]|nr:VOC family protein [Rhizobiaceae bacterium]